MLQFVSVATIQIIRVFLFPEKKNNKPPHKKTDYSSHIYSSFFEP